ncbi:MAG: GNAT family N-acetyltransferase [Saprospiraceae bacterium]
MLEFLLDFAAPNQPFWEAYEHLWENSQYRSSFKSPHFIKYLSSLALGSLATFKCYRGDKLIGATFFYKKGNTYHFLTDMKTDHNFFMLDRSITPEETERYFKRLVEEFETRKWSVRLNNQPFWTSYIDIFMQTLKQSNLFWQVTKYNPCLVLEESTPEALFQSTNKQKLRQKLNRLKDMGTVQFEVYEKDEDLDHWLEEYYDAHIRRWADTSTPSQFTSTEKRDFYKSCLQAWIADGVMVRFSIKLNDKRIGFVVAVIENGYLVHHSTTFDPEYEKQSPGLIIINLIGKWMADKGMTKMEFGDGGEKYKYQFSKSELPLNQIFISQPHNFPFILRSKMVHFMREHQEAHLYYNDKIRPRLLKSRLFKKLIT